MVSLHILRDQPRLAQLVASTKAGSFPEKRKRGVFVNLAVGDAKALGAAFERAGAGLYADVRVRTVLDDNATVSNLDAIVSQISAEVQPRDTFLFFAAAHGYSNEGRFYLIPQD